MRSKDPSSDSDSSVNEKISKIIFKIKKYYIIYVQNGENMDFNISKTATKNTLIYRIFNKENWE